MSRLPPLPQIDVRILDQKPTGRAFLEVKRAIFQNRYPDGALSPPYPYDSVERHAVDAVAILLVARESAKLSGARIALRSALRPPILHRRNFVLPLPDSNPSVSVWEVPAGLIEPSEQGVQGILECAARETKEETGIELSPSDFSLLGHAVYLSAGLMAEKIYFAYAEVSAEFGVPLNDGSPVEEGSAMVFLPIEDALRAIDEGVVIDAKTEVGLHRVIARINGR